MTEFVERAFKRAGPPIVYFSCGAMSAWMLYIYFWNSKFSNDFSVYWRTANRPVELAYAWSGPFPFPYAPTMLLWIQPLAFIPKWPAFFIFVAVSAVAFILACRPYLSRTEMALVLITRSFVRGLATGQVCALLAAMLIWACGAKNRILGGVAFGVIATIKPHLVLMAPLMLVFNRDWRAFVSAGATFAGVALLSTVAFGPDRWQEWVDSMGSFQQAVENVKAFSIGITPAMWAVWLGLPPLPFILAGTLTGAALVYFCRSTGPLERSTAIAAGSLMAAPYALDYDLISLFPFLALLVMRGRIWAVLGLVAALHPLPLAITAYELLRKATIRLPRRKVLA